MTDGAALLSRRPLAGDRSRPAPAPTAMTVAVLGPDPATERFWINGLTGLGAVDARPAAGFAEAELVLVIAERPDDSVISRLADVVAEAGRIRPVVLHCREMAEYELFRGLDHGLAAVVPDGVQGIGQVLEVLRSVRREEILLSQPIQRALLDRLRQMRGQSRTPRPSDREREVLRLLGEGLSTAQVAERINFSERTIKNIVGDLCTRYSAQNRTHLVAHALKTGLI